MKEYYTNEDFEVIIKKLEDFISFCSSKMRMTSIYA